MSDILETRGGGEGYQIKAIVAFIAVDPKKKEEGVIGLNINGMRIPAVCSDMERYNLLKSMVEKDAELLGIEYKIVKFSHREEIPREQD